nr:flagellar biosynthetic protein FliR [Tropicimonas sp. IMCC34043]
MDAFQTLLDLGGTSLLEAASVFLRIGAAMALLPAFSERMIPVRIRLAVALAFTAVVAPAVAAAPMPMEPSGFVRLLGTETLVGLVFGLALRLLVMALQIAGSIAAQSTSLSQLLGGAATEPLPAFGHVLVISGFALATISGLHVRIAEAFVNSYQVVPLGQLLSPDTLADFDIAKTGQAFSLAFSLAAPFVIAAFIYNLALGAINRAMPQLMVVLIGAPAITGASLAMLALLAPFMLQIWMAALDAALTDPLGMP